MVENLNPARNIPVMTREQKIAKERQDRSRSLSSYVSSVYEDEPAPRMEHERLSLSSYVSSVYEQPLDLSQQQIGRAYHEIEA